MTIEERFEEIYFDMEHGISAAIAECVIHQSLIAALTLIYSAIDSLAFLNTSATKNSVSRSDYVAWTQKYMDLQKLGVTALELYAARCGIVHSYAAESELYRLRKVRLIFYAWGSAQPLKGLKADQTMIHVNELADALIKGTQALLTEVTLDSQKAQVVEKKLDKVFGNIVST
jgi:hypothetical protein